MLATLDWGSIWASAAGAIVAGLGVTLAFAVGRARTDPGRGAARGRARHGCRRLGDALAQPGCWSRSRGAFAGLLIVASDGPLF